VAVVWAIISAIIIASPIIVVALAFIDAARRPEWAWSLAGRSRVMWMTMMVAGGVTVILGPFVALAYFVRARPDVAAAERGDIIGKSPDAG
jgi:hypothetical protein